ncbi:uncharacterized protein NDAI_0A04050 [Naumovozyma dairenensis CBS 421]|uniref:Uncharacterized protein n=1 Tax=Naumovozyma dairenensis (strain ATCC 10597 / BCRC 20456 / CBS 421 / NBRC 0211 / NRRL Y-12639) TaxID=1071378 RepID=G0W424_NAUDC|nr:hypothetical protein NDAI_0A04050 [Naumovozyma dairenensis CBS 421]CCD22562.1 hypothetical protein NDAI_0A04050 [Naumovozyma dairenensis CBS 421]
MSSVTTDQRELEESNTLLPEVITTGFVLDEEEEDEIKNVENPYLKMFGQTPAIDALRNSERTKNFNTYEYAEFYCPELFGFKSLKPFRNYKGLVKETKDDDNRNDSYKESGKSFSRSTGMEKYVYGEDPIKFVQQFLREYQKRNILESKSTIYTTFRSLLPAKLTAMCAASDGKEDPDALIEQFVLTQVSWHQLVKNAIDTLKLLDDNVIIAERISQSKVFLETASWVKTNKRLRNMMPLLSLSNSRAREFNSMYQEERFNEDFNLTKAIYSFTGNEVATLTGWSIEHPQDVAIIAQFPRIEESELRNKLGVSKYTDAKYESLKDFITAKDSTMSLTMTKLNKEENDESQTKKIAYLEYDYAFKLTDEEWTKNKPIIKRTNSILGTNFTANPYANNTEFQATGRQWTTSAFKEIIRDRRCKHCGHKKDKNHYCSVDMVIYSYRVSKPRQPK